MTRRREAPPPPASLPSCPHIILSFSSTSYASSDLYHLPFSSFIFSTSSRPFPTSFLLPPPSIRTSFAPSAPPSPPAPPPPPLTLYCPSLVPPLSSPSMHPSLPLSQWNPLQSLDGAPSGSLKHSFMQAQVETLTSTLNRITASCLSMKGPYLCLMRCPAFPTCRAAATGGSTHL